MPEAPFVVADEPDRLPPFSLGRPDDLPPKIKIPPLPTNDLKRQAQSDSPEKGVEAVAARDFTNANPQLREWAAQRHGAERRRAVFERLCDRLGRRLHGTDFSKTVPGGKEPKFKASLYSTLQQAALCVLSIVTLCSALNVAANYAIETGAWSSLVEQPATAFLFVIAAPAGGLAFVLLISQTLETDHARKRLAQIVAALTLIAWTLWLVAFGRLYGLQSEIGDAGGRAMPPRVMDEIRDLHAAMLLLQIMAEVLAGAAFKLLWSLVHWRNIVSEIVPSAAMKFLRTEFDLLCEAENQAARFVGRIDDYQDNYRRELAGFTADCQAELHRLKNGVRAVEAAGRAEYLAPVHTPVASRETKEIGS